MRGFYSEQYLMDHPECKFWLESVVLASSHGFSARELNQIRAIIDRHLPRIQEAWNEHCG